MDLSSTLSRLPSIISETKDEILKDTLFDWTNDKLVKYNNKL